MLEINEIKVLLDSVPIIDGLSLKIEEKGIFGILCSDGNVRNMLADVLCGAKNANSGEILYNGCPMSRNALQLKRKIRLASSTITLEPSMTCFEYLELVSNSLKLGMDKKYKQIEEALELVELEAQKNKAFTRLDGEKKIKLSIAASLIGNPDFIIVNEPFENIYGEALEQIYELLRFLGTLKTVILLSHEPDKVKHLCSSVAIVSGGRVALCGSIDEIERKINATHELLIKVKGEQEAIVAAIKTHDTVINVKVLSTEENGIHCLSVEHYPDDLIKDRLFESLADINAPMLSVKQITLTLGDVYYSYSKDREENV